MTSGKAWIFSLFACERKHSGAGVIHLPGADQGRLPAGFGRVGLETREM